MVEAQYQLLYHENSLGEEGRHPNNLYVSVRLEKWWGPAAPHYIVTAGYKVFDQYGGGWVDDPPRTLLSCTEDAPAIRQAIAMYDQLKAAAYVSK